MRRPTIGITISNLHGHYAEILAREAVAWANAHDCNLLIFPGRYYLTEQDGVGWLDESLIHQEVWLFDYACPPHLDAMVLISGAFLNYMDQHRLVDLARQLAKVPLVSVGVELAGYSSVVVDNASGFREAVRHLIEVHGIRRPVFVGAARGNLEGDERKAAFLEEMDRAGIAVGPERMFHGTFDAITGRRAALYFLDECRIDFDAVVAVSDELADTFVRELQGRNIVVPDDVAVIGFDNIGPSRSWHPPLTTVHQPVKEQIGLALEIALAESRGQQGIRREVLPSVFVQRRSCGCRSLGKDAGRTWDEPGADKGLDARFLAQARRELENPEAGPSVVAALIQRLNRILDQVLAWGDDLYVWQEAMRSALDEWGRENTDPATLRRLQAFSLESMALLGSKLISERTARLSRQDLRLASLRNFFWLLTGSTDPAHLAESLQRVLPGMGIGEFYIAVYPEQAGPPRRGWRMPAEATLMAAFHTQDKQVRRVRTRRISTASLPAATRSNRSKPFHLVYSPLFFRKHCLGYVLCEYTDLTPNIFDAVVGYYSAAVENAHEVRRTRHAQGELQALTAELERQVLERTRQLSQNNESLLAERERAEEASMAKSRFLATMSHEIRTPLNAVLGFAEALTYSDDPGLVHELAGKIVSEGNNLLGLINQLLDLGRIEAGRQELDQHSFVVRDVLEGVREALDNQKGTRDLEIRLEIDPAIPEQVRGDSGRLRQVLLNLGGNAVKFTPRGRVSLRCTLERSLHERCIMRFEVQDTGIGMSRDFVARVFEPFSQQRDERIVSNPGVGLGAAIAHQLVALMGGTLAVESEPDRGSCFHFSLAFRRVSVSVPEKSEEQETGYLFPEVLRNARILIAEDFSTNAELLKFLLGGLGADLRVAVNGLEACEAFEQDGADIILMDMHMPVMDGLEATRRIRNGNRGRHVPVLGITANAFESDRIACLNAGMDDVLTKPLRKNLLIEKIGLLLDQPMAWSALVETVGSEADALDLVEGFCCEARSRIDAARSALSWADWRILRREAHSLKGASLNLIAPRLYRAARALESAVSAEQYGRLEMLFRAMDQAYREVEAYLVGRGLQAPPWD